MRIPFYFTVSNTIPSSDSQSPEQCLQLPPSVELGRVIIENNTRKRYAQPNITYAVKAIVHFAGDDEIRPPVETSLPFVLSPLTKEFPPTDTVDFPAEFKLEESKPLRLSLFGQKLGIMTVKMSEPRPLVYGYSSLRSFTECHLQLRFSPTHPDATHEAFQAMKFSIHSLIRVKTFYSVKSFSTLPSQKFVGNEGKTGLRDELVKLERREIPHVAWAYVPPYDSTSLVTSGRSSADIVRPENGAGFEPAGVNTPPRLPGAEWTATITHPIRMEGQLVPTFCCSIAARLYTVILRLKISGIRRESFDLEVPLQVVHTASNLIPESEERMFGELDADPLPLIIRRTSEASSWFSDESFVSTVRLSIWIILTPSRMVQISSLIIILDFLDHTRCSLMSM